MHILIDVDCVLADFVGAVLNLVEKTDRDAATEYDWWEKVYTPEEGALVRHTLDTSGHFWQNLPLIDDAKSAIDWLRSEEHKITYCTAPYSRKYGWESDRRLFLEKNFEIDKYGEDIAFFSSKYMVNANCIIDDMVSNVLTWEEKNRKGLGFIFKSELNRQSGRELIDWKDIMSMRFFQREKSVPLPVSY